MRSKGGQPQTEEQRRDDNPIHDAADEARRIEDILRDHYPEQSAEQIRTAAYGAVAPRWGVRANTLANYFKRGEERRLSHP